MGKNILIIGASGDIGSAIAEKLGREGYQLLLHYNKNREKINYLRNTVGNECILSEIQADLSSQSGVIQLLQEIPFHVDGIVFASGNAYYELFQNTSEAKMDEMLNIHVKSPMIITKNLLPSMIKQQYGKIVFITSIWGDIGASYEVIYSAVKGAQNSFIKALAKETGPSGVLVNGISPGFVDTKMNAHLQPEDKSMIVSDIPLQRVGLPKDIANAVRFLMDEESNYIHGEIIRINGGW
ncbi:3-oxoacyl-[acyl-carrier protein] reductase [Oceanobacillus limi]|uniref:3-oxoacyl-[acyl-carrier protein] reductase n=1 Tax=Oceanobacillus limi TaxID=930131 RepID=A0A1H9Z5Z9_9BACI|nr:SDR family oxidoreductase [Oceanobacillus limi]SES76933.1 3-oxoacyl-[acyl-carrier protein] reductase [Oceanobacillus limi]